MSSSLAVPWTEIPMFSPSFRLGKGRVRLLGVGAGIFGVQRQSASFLRLSFNDAGLTNRSIPLRDFFENVDSYPVQNNLPNESARRGWSVGYGAREEDGKNQTGRYPFRTSKWIHYHHYCEGPGAPFLDTNSLVWTPRLHRQRGRISRNLAHGCNAVWCNPRK